jgi:hypothetical protein
MADEPLIVRRDIAIVAEPSRVWELTATRMLMTRIPASLRSQVVLSDTSLLISIGSSIGSHRRARAQPEPGELNGHPRI